MDSKRVQITAKGAADLMQNSLDMISTVKLRRAKTAAEKFFSEPVSVRVHGPFDALKYELDKDSLKTSTSGALKNEAREKLDAEKKQVQEKARQELKKNTQKIEDKLKNKFKGLF